MPLRQRLRRLRASGWWKPAVAVHIVRDARAQQDAAPLPTDAQCLQGAAAWLAQAQDAAADGGICGRYRLAGGWTSSYPETTGYAIPTLLTLADVLGDDTFRERAARCVDFLLSVQLESGGFPGLEIADNRTKPSPFNSAQIIHGLREWYVATRDRRVLDPIRRAGVWMCDAQDADGPWRKHWYGELACAYSAHAACWLADAGDTLDEPRFLDAARRNLHWVLAQHDPQSGWFDRSGFSAEDHRLRRAHTHTIAYTLDGVRRLAQRFDVKAGTDAVRAAAERLLLRLERSRTLPGVLDHEWRAQCTYVCLTGNAQVASIWLNLARTVGDLRYANAAFKAIDQIKRAQSLDHSEPGIRGGIPGSSPIGGDYIQYALPNWAAKFFVDALCAKRDCLLEWGRVAPSATVQPSTPIAVRPTGRPVRTPPVVAVLTTRISPTFAALAESWYDRGFAPALVIIETGGASRARRWWSTAKRRADDSARICRVNGWRCVLVDTVNDDAAVAAMEHAQPDLAVAAGAGILRRRALAIPKLGTLNAHMGILPRYRGMNVAEWAALNRDPVGCSVFFVDEGIDTGPIVATQFVETGGCTSIDELRARVNRTQLALLDEVLRTIVDTGQVPGATTQPISDGRQYFRMHADFRSVLQQRLQDSAIADRTTYSRA